MCLKGQKSTLGSAIWKSRDIFWILRDRGFKWVQELIEFTKKWLRKSSLKLLTPQKLWNITTMPRVHCQDFGTPTQKSKVDLWGLTFRPQRPMPFKWQDLKTSLFRQHWPIGRAIFHTKNKDMVAWVNHSEHLTMRSLEKRGNVRAAVSRLQSFVSILQKQLKFSKNETLGYLTLKPQCIGICFLAAKTALQILIFFCVWSTWNSVNSKVVQGSSRACMHLHKLSCT